MKSSPTRFILTTSITLLVIHSVHAGDFSIQKLTGDADSGINSALTYTTAVDYVGPGNRAVNGVTFADTTTGTLGGVQFLEGTVNNFTGYAQGITGSSIADMLTDFRFGSSLGNGVQVLTLSGLTPGEQYVTSWYSNSFGSGNGRYIDITPSDSGTPFRFNQDGTNRGSATVLRYAFIAPSSSITYTFDAVADADTFHHYAMTNAVRNDSLFSYTHFTPVAPTINRVSNSTTPFAVSSTDLLQTNLSGVTSTGNFNGEGILGTVPDLADGQFSITGINQNNPELVTGENNSSVTFTLDTTVNALGYDISSIAGYGGWNDGGRDRQHYSIFFSQVGSPDFVFFGEVDDNPQGQGSPSAVEAIFNTSLTGIDQIRIEFLEGQENGFAGYGEFDVVGMATVPEPTSAGLLLLGGLGVLLRRRRN